MNEKIVVIESDQVQVLDRLINGIDSIKFSVDFEKLDELKRDVHKALEYIESVTSRLDSIEKNIHGTNSKTADLHGLHDTGSEILEAVERSSSWGFWIYFVLFQFVFWSAFIWWKRSADAKIAEDKEL